MPHYAHSLRDDPDKSKWETLPEHEAEVAQRCRDFLTRIDESLGDWGEVLGKWHDLGKYSSEFQQYICNANDPEATSETRDGKRVDHSTAGAQHAEQRFGQIGNLLAYCLAGHHAGLPDWISQTENPRSGLSQRLKKQIKDYSAAPESLLNIPQPSLWPSGMEHGDGERLGFQLSMLIRVCFSALCDADFLATEQFMDSEKSQERPLANVSLAQMSKCLDEYMQNLQSGNDTHVNRMRREALSSCIEAASLPPGLFSLNVPTGGGKTLASLSFGLHHAVTHGLDRVIYAIPFTNIIEQTADEFRNVFDTLASELVLEHHSNLDPDQESVQARLASENWDSPLVVTTNVQFFESLFAAKTSRSRKVHRIARSVIILDEAQTLPINLLKPCLSALQELCSLFGSTIVLCTATQPAIEYRDSFPIGLKNVRPIIKDPFKLYAKMKRVRCKLLGKTDDKPLCQQMSKHEQLLCIVNTRRHAAKLFKGLKKLCRDGSVFHLSTFMCAAHRKQVLAAIKKRLKLKLPCRVVSTQLIEAGVDIDFPVVYRALAGLDSIAQAAGRCNREGKLEYGRLFIFEPNERLRGLMRQAADKAREVIAGHDDILSLDAIEQYFRLYYWQQSNIWDEHEIVKKLSDPQGKVFHFRTAAEHFRMIEETSKSLFVPWGDAGEALEEELRSAKFVDRFLRRKSQRFLVPVFERDFNASIGSDIDINAVEGIPLLLNQSMYDEELGLCIEKAGQQDPERSFG